MFPSIINPHLQPKQYFGGCGNTTMKGGILESIQEEDNVYHKDKYRDYLRRIKARMLDDRNNERKFLNGVYPQSVVSYGNAQGSGNKMFFDNPPNTKNHLKGGVLSTEKGRVYAMDILQNRGAQMEEIDALRQPAEQDVKSNVNLEQPVPLSATEFSQMKVNMFLNDIITALDEEKNNLPESIANSISEFNKVTQEIFKNGFSYSIDELNSIHDKLETIILELRPRTQSSKSKIVLKYVQQMKDIIEQFIATINEPIEARKLNMKTFSSAKIKAPSNRSLKQILMTLINSERFYNAIISHIKNLDPSVNIQASERNKKNKLKSFKKQYKELLNRLSDDEIKQKLTGNPAYDHIFNP